MTKVFVVLTSILSIAVSCLFIAAAAQWDNWRDLAARYQQERDAAFRTQQSVSLAAQAALAQKDDALAERARQIDDLQKNIVRNGEDLAKARVEKAQAVNEKLASEAGRTKLQELLDVTTGEVKSLQKQNQTLLASNMDLQSRNAKTNSRVIELTTNVTILTDQVRHMQEKLVACEQRGGGGVASAVVPRTGELAGAIPTGVAVKGEIRGQITDVNGSYASVNVGESSGVGAGMTFMVHRDGVYLGELVIDSVRPREAGGKLIVLAGGGDIRPGDQVVAGLGSSAMK